MDEQLDKTEDTQFEDGLDATAGAVATLEAEDGVENSETAEVEDTLDQLAEMVETAVNGEGETESEEPVNKNVAAVVSVDDDEIVIERHDDQAEPADEFADIDDAEQDEDASAMANSAYVPHPCQTQSCNRYSKLLVAHHDRGGAIAEEYRALRTSVLANCHGEKFCYLVTSPEVGEGKTLTCLNLAMVMAERVNQRTIVIDCNFRSPAVAGLLGESNTPGLAELIRGEATLDEVVKPTAYPNLLFIAAGRARQDQVGELLGRPELRDLSDTLRREYDYVLFDTPSINHWSDAAVTGRATGGALLVVRMNKTHREAVEKSMRLLNAANIALTGLVMTHARD